MKLRRVVWLIAASLGLAIAGGVCFRLLDRQAEFALDSVRFEDGRFWHEESGERVTGYLVEYYKDGSVRSRSFVREGRNDGASVAFYANGQKQVEEWFVDGVANGIRTKWYENGVKASEGRIESGAFEGVYRTWDEEGNLRAELAFSGGVPDGVSRTWYADGSLERELLLRNGKIVSKSGYEETAPIESVR